MNRLGLTGSGGGGFINQALYALLAGRAGGQTLKGGTAANDDLTLEGTAHSTKTTSYVILQPTAGNVGVNTVSPLTALHVVGAATITGGIRPAADSTAALTLCKANGDAVVTVDTTNGRVGIGINNAALSNVALSIGGTVASGNNAFGIYMGGIILSPAAANSAYFSYAGGGNVATGGGTIASAAAYFAAPIAKTGGGTLTTAYGLYVGDNTAATTNYAIYTETNPVRFGGNIELAEMTAPGAGAANTARIYAVDNGAGKTLLMVQFATGAAQQISIEP